MDRERKFKSSYEFANAIEKVKNPKIYESKGYSLRAEKSKKKQYKRRLTKFFKLRNFYIAPEKNKKLAFIYSFIVPYLGSFYLTENPLQLFVALFSSFIIAFYSFSLMTVLDFTSKPYHHQICILFILIWIFSMFDLRGVNRIFKKNRKEYIANPSMYGQKKNRFSDIANSKYLKLIPIVLLILFVSTNLMVDLDDSNRIYDCEDFSLEYSKDFYVMQEYPDFILANKSHQYDHLSIDTDYSNNLEDYRVDYFGNRRNDTTIDGLPALEDGKEIITVKNGKAFFIYYGNNSVEEKKKIIDTLRFK